MNGADRIRDELRRAASAIGAGDDVDVVLERPRDPSFGDWTTNLAMTLARTLKRKPRDIADALIAEMQLGDAGVRAAEVAGAGFINFRLDPAFVARGIAPILERDQQFGRDGTWAGEPVVVEFVSANPTGPLHVGHGRQAALGDAIATLLEWTGWKVSREFYYNDAGAQIENLAKSTWVRTAQLAGIDAPIPEGGYNGEYIREIAETYVREHDMPPVDVLREGVDAINAGRRPHDLALLEAMRKHAVAALRAEQNLDLQAFGVAFDTYYLESSLYAPGSAAQIAPDLHVDGDASAVDATVQAIVRNGATYEEDGALFLRTTQWGDDKDRVMRKSAAKGGDFTYFVPDVAYHVTKWERGFRRAINVQGSDHHGTTARVRAGLQALGVGVPPGYPEYVLHQMVTVTRGGEEVKISKRAGSYVTVRDLIDWVGRDGVRYFYLQRKGDSHLVFDVDLARSQSEENPIYRIQMAHARMSGIFRQGGLDAATFDFSGVDFAQLAEPAEQELVNALVDFPRIVSQSAENLEPHRLAGYLLETAGLVHGWYHKHHVLGQEAPLMTARLALARAAQIVLRNGLSILGISAPDRM
ncbi:arginine--tRNA ligase [Roseisolibacter agri]|uniref:Arginine--tRNA ligase n=1 Tax=Roseisolibacter agri TaxID=2014610 RepID=A0AA37VF98_9BACT|nr:arginine--tRNA ligase [Roseisolibacter agri]GLC26519.1 arginine--tRNA ligase [Roseisolibacter agri]